MTAALAIGVDVGGTKIALAAVDAQGHIHAQQRIPTRAGESPDLTLDRMAQAVRSLLTDTGIAPDDTQRLLGIGIGCPGPVDSANGVAQNAVNLGWREVPVCLPLRDRLQLPGLAVFIENDVKAAALGEYVYGAARDCDNFVYVAIGTGLGGCAMLNGRIINGASGMATELGHVVSHPGGRLCPCGQRGCVEMSASGKGLLAAYADYQADYPASTLNDGQPISTARILAAARAGDPLSQRITDEAADTLGLALAWTVGVLNPSRIVIGGGLGHAAADLLLRRAQAVIQARTLPDAHAALDLIPGALSEAALGAAALVWHRQ